MKSNINLKIAILIAFLVVTMLHTSSADGLIARITKQVADHHLIQRTTMVLGEDFKDIRIKRHIVATQEFAQPQRTRASRPPCTKTGSTTDTFDSNLARGITPNEAEVLPTPTTTL